MAKIDVNPVDGEIRFLGYTFVLFSVGVVPASVVDSLFRAIEMSPKPLESDSDDHKKETPSKLRRIGALHTT